MKKKTLIIILVAIIVLIVTCTVFYYINYNEEDLLYTRMYVKNEPFGIATVTTKIKENGELEENGIFADQGFRKLEFSELNELKNKVAEMKRYVSKNNVVEIQKGKTNNIKQLISLEGRLYNLDDFSEEYRKFIHKYMNHD